MSVSLWISTPTFWIHHFPLLPSPNNTHSWSSSHLLFLSHSFLHTAPHLPHPQKSSRRTHTPACIELILNWKFYSCEAGIIKIQRKDPQRLLFEEKNIRLCCPKEDFNRNTLGFLWLQFDKNKPSNSIPAWDLLLFSFCITAPFSVLSSNITLSPWLYHLLLADLPRNWRPHQR